jgi:hypothetical protein
MKQLPLDFPEQGIQVEHQRRWSIYPRILSVSAFQHAHCYLQAIHSYRKNKYLLHFIYSPEHRSHLPSSSRWRKILRRYRIEIEDIRLVRRISKLVSIATHRGTEVTLPTKLQKRYVAALEGRIRFKKATALDCLSVQFLVGCDFTPGFAEVFCLFIPETNQLFVIKTTYTQSDRRLLGFVGARREAILHKVKQECVSYWKKHLTYQLFD